MEVDELKEKLEKTEFELLDFKDITDIIRNIKREQPQVKRDK